MRETYMFVDASEVIGRGHDKECVINCLLNWSVHDGKNPRVLPIIAIGGMGKTTLVQMVMNDHRVRGRFDMTIWACTSKEFILETAVLRILQSATGENYSGLHLDALQRKLREVSAYKTYLIVLDDVWVEDSRQWLKLKDLLAVGGRGSTILVTTREERVASLTGTMKPYRLKELSDMDCWSIFLKYAFSEGEEKAYPMLVEISKSIIKKCRGVPLAAKTLGSLLRYKRDYGDWKSIEESELWEIDQGPDDILPALKLSFDHAPHLLRLCFASCAIFGKGYPLCRSDLINLWMAHGCFDGSTEDALDLGDSCFAELISRSFFQLPDCSITKKDAMIQEEDFSWKDGQVKYSHMGDDGDAISQGFRAFDGKVICVEMHDLLHDLASYVAREETAVVGRKKDNVSIRTRNLVWDRKQHLAEDFPMDLLSAKNATAFAFLYPMECISLSFLDTLISNFRFLRILIFNCCSLKRLPESIGNLEHLRYLDLRGNSQLELLPHSVCNLADLKVLDLGGCECLEMLPENVHRLISLRTLTLTFRFKRLPERALRRWDSLQVLKLVSCPNLESLSEEFGSLMNLRVLIIQECDRLVHIPDNVSGLTKLEHITLESCRELDLEGWEGLHGLVRLQVLVIDDLPRLWRIPEMHMAARTLQYLKVSNCKSFSSFPESLRICTSLLKLQVFNCCSLKRLPNSICFLTNLEHITLESCRELDLEGWEGLHGLFRLQVLVIDDLPRLREIPEMGNAARTLQYLKVSNCCSLKRLTNSFCFLANLEHITLESCRELDLEGWEGLHGLFRLQVLVIDDLPRLREIPEMDDVARTLQYLKVSNCKSFSSFPESLGFCTSLLKLQVFNCPSLTSLPREIQGLSRLQELRISGCPELSQRCEREIGDQWRFIADIPEVYIDEKVIQSYDEPTKQAQAGAAHYPVEVSYIDTLISKATLKETTLKYGWSGGDSRSNQTERHSAISPDEVTQLTSPTPTEIVPVWNEDQHTPHAVPAAEHHDPALPVGFDNQALATEEECDSDFSTRGGSTRGTSIASLDLLVHPEIHASRDDNNNGINKEEAKGMLFLFGEGYEFEKQMLIQLWMALGLLAVEPMEEKGAFYFENLVSERYILCSVPNYLYKVNFEKLGTEVNSEKQSCIKLDRATQNSDSSAETLHASVGWDEINASVLQTLRGFSRLRTLLFLGSYSSRLQQVPRDLFLCFESLEALDLSGTHIKELPILAGKMINLRYLDLSWTLIEALPERIDRFKKLQTLKLEGCSRLRKLPNEMEKLINLRHLYLDVLRDLAAFPRGMGALLKIRTLSGFPVGTKQGLKISELKYLNDITGSFCIANIENVQSANEAKEAFLNKKKNINKLKLKWSDCKTGYPTNEAEVILQNLCPCSDVEEVQIVCYPGIKLPDWIADVSFDKLANITLFGCAKLNMLPSMENLPSLASLELVSLNSLTKLDFKGVAGEYVAFPKLQKLSIDEMLNLETWAEAEKGDYPCIEELSIKDCPKLSEFPSIVYVPSLKHLEVSGCESVVLKSDKTLPEFLEQLRIEDCPLMEDRC